MQAEWRRAAAYVVCRDDAGRLLLTRLSSSDPAAGMWTMPGGGMDWGESPEETAVRELYEETGLTATMGPILGVFSQWFSAEESWQGQAGHVIAPIYEALDITGSLRTEFDPGSTDAVKWFTIAEIPHLPRVDLVDFVLEVL